MAEELRKRCIRASDTEWQLFQEAAKARKLSRSDWIRRTLRRIANQVLPGEAEPDDELSAEERAKANAAIEARTEQAMEAEAQRLAALTTTPKPRQVDLTGKPCCANCPHWRPANDQARRATCGPAGTVTAASYLCGGHPRAPKPGEEQNNT